MIEKMYHDLIKLFHFAYFFMVKEIDCTAKLKNFTLFVKQSATSQL